MSDYQKIATIFHKSTGKIALVSILTDGQNFRWRAEVEGVAEGFRKDSAFDCLQDALFHLIGELGLEEFGFRVAGKIPTRTATQASSRSSRRNQAVAIAARMLSNSSHSKARR